MADAVTRLELDPQQVEGALGLPSGGLQDLMHDRAVLGAHAAAPAATLVALHACLHEVTTNPQGAANWMRRPNPQLGGTPAELISGEAGIRKLHEYVLTHLVGTL